MEKMNLYIPRSIRMTTRAGWSSPASVEEARRLFPSLGAVTIDRPRGQASADWGAYQHLFAIDQWAGALGADKWALASGFDRLTDALVEGRVPDADDILAALAEGAEQFLLLASASPAEAYPWECLPPPRVQPDVPQWGRLEYLLATEPAATAPDSAPIGGQILARTNLGWFFANPYAA